MDTDRARQKGSGRAFWTEVVQKKDPEVERNEARLVDRGGFIVKLTKLKLQDLSFAQPLLGPCT